MNISPQTLRNGQQIKKELESNPATFAQDQGVIQVRPTRDLDQTSGTRMAGQMGARALELMGNPQEAQRVDEWMAQFGQSNQGSQFNQAKMQQAMQMAAANRGQSAQLGVQ